MLRDNLRKAAVSDNNRMSMLKGRIIRFVCYVAFCTCSTNVLSQSLSHISDEYLRGKYLYHLEEYEQALHMLTPYASLGDAKAQYLVGSMFFWGNGTRKDTKQGIEWIFKSSEQGYVFAQYKLADILYNGRGGIEKDKQKALLLFQNAAEQGHAKSQFKLGDIYSIGALVDKNEVLAEYWYEKAIIQDTNLKARLADYYHHGIIVEQDLLKAVVLYKDVIEKEHVYADRPPTITFRVASANESVSELIITQAMYSLGYLYADTKNQDLVDGKKALMWLHRAADREYEEAYSRLGEIYDQGDIVPEDDATAIYWYKKYVENALYDFMSRKVKLRLGEMHALGEGVKESCYKAMRWFNSAFEEEDKSNPIVEKDRKRTIFALIAFKYYEGEVVPKDDVQAYIWANISLDKGIRELIEKKMSRSQIAEAQRLTRECLSLNE